MSDGNGRLLRSVSGETAKLPKNVNGNATRRKATVRCGRCINRWSSSRSSSKTAPKVWGPYETEHMRFTRLSDGDDIEAYLTTIERMTEAYGVSREHWPFKLAPQLMGKAQQAYAALPPEGAKVYDTLKVVILCRYNINEETYRKHFRSLEMKMGETPWELVTRLQDLAAHWTRECKSAEELLDLIVTRSSSSTCYQRTSGCGLRSGSPRPVVRPES